MTVADLIAALGRLDPSTEVFTSDCCYGLSKSAHLEMDAVLIDGSNVRSAEHCWDWAEDTFDEWADGDLVQAVVVR